MKSYNHKELDAYFQKKWEEENLYTTDTKSSKPTFYGLVEFPYPSGAGLHAGHVRSYTAMDIIVRKRRMEGYETLFPIGWDAFGLPAENYAIKTGIHPSITTQENIANFRRQLKACGFSFDFNREVDTTDPTYYKWTQWIFLKLYEHNLAYKKNMPVNWCPKDKCVLANEEVVDGVCERCGTIAEKRDKEQWMLAITKYAERLDKDLDDTTFLDKIKIQQRNWIGLSEGSEIPFKITSGTYENVFTVFTTRADTLFGCTYCVLAPEHPIVSELIEKHLLSNEQEVIIYRDEAKRKLDIDRGAEGREKTGVKLEGFYAVNPVNDEAVPIFIADYVLPQYGTGAIMAVPAHDERDYEFAVKYNLSVKQVIAQKRYDLKNPFVDGWPIVERTMVQVILKNPKDNRYLTLQWKNLPWTTFVGGGLEDGETPQAAALRELEEEAGIKNVTYVQELPIVRSEYSANHKQQNRVSYCSACIFEMNDTTEITGIAKDEDDQYEKVWTSLENLPDSFVCSEWDIWQEAMQGSQSLSGEEGVLINSGKFNELDSSEARKKITEAVGGKVVTKSKLRDWVFARQRYWGEPIPLVYDTHGKMYPVAESELPIVLPQVDKYEPTDNGESPLYQVPEWVNVRGEINSDGKFIQSKSGELFKRETDTMPQWAGSSWYFMRYIDPHNSEALGDKDMLMKWLPVTWYNGGMEHTTLHLLYSRFWYKFLYDIGLTPTSEPYIKRTSQGMILGSGGVKMSKSLGNVVNPDDIIKEYGADVLRVYEMFIGPFDQAVAWEPQAIVGIKRFFDRLLKLSEKISDNAKTLPVLHQTIKKVTDNIEQMAFNTSVSQMMICVNEYEKQGSISKHDFSLFLKIIAPFAPYITEAFWQDLGYVTSIHKEAWPQADEKLAEEDEVTYAIQITGKLRGTIVLPKDLTENQVMEQLKNHEIYIKYIGSENPKKVIFVPNRLVNIVI